MAQNNNFLKNLLADERGAQSIKRFIALIGTLVLCATLILTTYVKEVNPLNTELITAIEFIVIASIGATSVDKFTHKPQLPIVPPTEEVAQSEVEQVQPQVPPQVQSNDQVTDTPDEPTNN